jgi:hypothetical protein
MGQRVYAARFENVTIAAVQDVLSLRAAGAANGCELHHIMLSASGVTAAAEIRLNLKRLPATVTAGSVGTAPTIGAVDSGDTKAATAVVRANDTTQATTSGTAFIIASWAWNVLGMFEYLPAPEDREVIQSAEALVLEIPGTPTASTVVSGMIKWREMP